MDRRRCRLGRADPDVPGGAEPGLLVLCSDGLWNYFEDVERLSDLVPRTAATPIEIARQFADAALDAGGNDNITVAVVPLGAARSELGPSRK